MARFDVRLFCFLAAMLVGTLAHGQLLDEALQRESVSELAVQAKAEGDAARGAVVFFQQQMACSKCHTTGDKPKASVLGPDLASLGKDVTDSQLVEAVVYPSKTIRKGFESVAVAKTDGTTINGIVVERSPKAITLRDVARAGELVTIAAADIDEVTANVNSIMPAGQMNQLNSRQQFYDLVKYLIEIRDGGAARAAQLQPPQSLLTFTLPEYEKRIDHAGLLGDWNAESKSRGEAIYNRVCANCHGTKDKPGSLPTSLRFAEGKFKNGSDPLSMYRTLTHGFGLMAPQTWMVPSQKYDVIHYIRETYLKPHNPSQFVDADAAYVAKLPKGDTRGPAPSNIVPWSAMDYGPTLTHTYEVPGTKHNFAYKGIALRLDPGAGGVSRGRHWMIFDTDTLRVAAAYNGTGGSENNFIDWQGIQFNGAHGIHPRIVGQTAWVNSTGPGWADPQTNLFADDRRVLGRDGRRYGPLPRDWGKFQGLYHFGQQTILSYTVGQTPVLEWPRLIPRENGAPLLARTFQIGPRDRDVLLQVAEHSAEQAEVTTIGESSTIVFAPPVVGGDKEDDKSLAFDGNSYLEVPDAKAFDLSTKDFTIAAQIKTRADGTIWALTQAGPKWIPNGQSFFIRGGRLAFDIGWVGAVTGRSKVADDRWHTVSMTWEKAGHRVRFFVDGKPDGEGTLAAKEALPESVVRIGFTSPNFPGESFFQGALRDVRFFQSKVTDLKGAEKSPDKTLVAHWLASDAGAKPGDDSTGKHHGQTRRGLSPVSTQNGPIIAGVAPQNAAVAWKSDQGQLRLAIPAGKESLRFTVWLPANTAEIKLSDAVEVAAALSETPIVDADADLTQFTRGGPPRWPQQLETQIVAGASDGAFASDVLTAPDVNPWLAQTRFTGLDFFNDGRMAVCSWDGDVWIVERKDDSKLAWRRIASGMFQPLGLKIVDERIHVTCRDQLAVLHDLNDDGEIDFYQCLNNDHQVTEHFHEFAMGLQTDADGNFYYAKSGCHGKEAVVPHHGTLLRVSKDGATTDILATGFRAANGVCLNPDGSFVVTDQEGFWNPKNRINWVTRDKSGKPRFYGNMWGYHDVKDTSDDAMEPPLCWITNEFDRSPAELLWVDSDKWGPLKGSLLNLSYGYGKVFLVPHENVNGKMQGGMIALPIPLFPTGVMRGRFHPGDGQLYLCGMFAWAGNATQPGGLYRLRATGQPIRLPTELHATKSGLRLAFADAIDPKSLDAKNFHIKTWSLKRSANYGSKHHDEKTLAVSSAKLSPDGKTLTLNVADLQPTWCMEIRYSAAAADGTPVNGVIHNTIHALGE